MDSTKKIILLEELRELVPISRTTIWRMEQAGNFPRCIRIGKRRVGWRYAEVVAWIDGRGQSPPE